MRQLSFRKFAVVLAASAIAVVGVAACTGTEELPSPAATAIATTTVPTVAVSNSTDAVTPGRPAVEVKNDAVISQPSTGVGMPAPDAPINAPGSFEGSGGAGTASRGVAAPMPSTPGYAPDYQSYPVVQQPYQNGIVVTGVGQKTVQPDLAKVYLGVESRAATVTEARQNAAEAMTAIRDALLDSGIDEKDIVTTSFNIYPETTWVEIKDTFGTRGEPRIIGYVVNNQVEVTVRDIDEVGTVVDTAADKGGNLIRINSVQFTVADPNTVAAETRKMAAQDARAKAQVYATAMGVNLGPLVHLSEGYSSSPVLYKEVAARGAMSADAAYAPTPITPGGIDLSTNITAVFSIIP